MTKADVTYSREPDSITVEVLRSRLEAIGHEAGIAIERTAISPVVSETKDYSVTILDPDGSLIVGTGYITGHFGASVHAVRSTLERHGITIRPGDVFIANDPHNGGGLHPQDVVVQRPAFVGDRLVGWVAVSAHMMDLGGMAPGSFAPNATECYQEALRLPPVRLLSEGVEMGDVWAIIRNNIRLAKLIEADIRALVVGCNVAVGKIGEVVSAMGCEEFALAIKALAFATEHEVRRRVSRIADGVYRSTGWLELGEYEVYAIPCTLTVEGNRLYFDFDGCPPELPRFFNTKPYILQASLMSLAHAWLAPDLPLSQPLLDVFEVSCPPRTLLNSSPPAPIGAAHMDASGAATSAAMRCLQFAFGASPDAPEHLLTTAPDAHGWAMMTWAFEGADGGMDTFVHTDGSFGGSPAGGDRDGLDLSLRLIGTNSPFELSDIEILESTYPILIETRKTGIDGHGAGAYRSGGGCHEILRAHGTPKLVGNMISTRGSVPNQGAAGGSVGARTALRIIRADGTVEDVGMQDPGVEVSGDDRFELRGPTGGGYGDPLGRDPEVVVRDLKLGRITSDEADRHYSVVLDSRGMVDSEQTRELRRQRRQERFSRAQPPRQPMGGATASPEGGLPLFPGIVQVGRTAVSVQSGAVLAVAPDPWIEGCPTIDDTDSGANGFVVSIRSYLDPITGDRLFQEILRPDGVLSFECSPDRWAKAVETEI
jgi:N-methylhydantoinase B